MPPAPVARIKGVGVFDVRFRPAIVPRRGGRASASCAPSALALGLVRRGAGTRILASWPAHRHPHGRSESP
jgi:hypothetical protein